MLARLTSILLLLMNVALFAQAPSANPQSPSPNNALDEIFGRKGQQQGDVYKVTFPRTDLKIQIGNVTVQPGVALTSWVAIRGTQPAVADGDLVVTSEELNPVLSSLQQNKLEITAVHNHLVGEEPQVYYVHFFGKGVSDELAKALKASLASTKTPMTAPAPPSNSETWDTKPIEAIMGSNGKRSGSVLSFSFPRSHSISMHHEEMTPMMGMATAVNFQPAPGGVAASGDFVLSEAEVNPVIAVLRRHGIQVTAVHNHMLNDEPRMVFVHFWAVGVPKDVASGLHEAVLLQK